jgi:hypothetical protein
MNISVTGNGLNVIILSNLDFHSEWMAFSSWYSLHKNIPDANVSLFVKKSKNLTKEYHKWANKANIKIKRISNIESEMQNLETPCLILEQGILAIRPLNKTMLNHTFAQNADTSAIFMNGDFKVYEKNIVDDLCVDCQSDKQSSFVNVNNCGNYNKNSWIEQSNFPPFPSANSLKTETTSVNERLVLNLWSSMSQAYGMMF